MNNYYTDTLTLLLSDQKTELPFILESKGNRIHNAQHTLTEQLIEIQIITDCDPEQPLIPYPENYYSPDILDLVLAQIISIEKYYHCVIPVYATLIRVLLFELHRLLNHFNYFVTLFQSIRFLKPLELSSVNSALINSLFKEIRQHKSLDKFIVIGGISTDIPDGFIENLVRTLDTIKNNLKHIERQFTRQTLFSDLLTDIGIISSAKAANLSLSGPNRIASLEISEYIPETMVTLPDFIESQPIQIDFSKGSIGDSWHRAWLRFLEIMFSIRRLSKLSDTILKTDVILMNQPSIVERSINFHTVITGSEGQIKSTISRKSHHFYFTGKHHYPVWKITKNLNPFLKNERLSSAKVILASLNLNPIRYHLKR